MRKNKYLIIFGIIFIVSLITAQGSFANTTDWPTLLKQTLATADKFTQVSNLTEYKSKNLTLAAFPAYQNDKQIGVIFYAAPKGYGGSIHMLTAVDMNGTIVKVNIFSHTETPAYVVPVDNGIYQKQFEGITLADKMSFLIGKTPTIRGEVMAITGSTETSKPIAVAVSEARKLFVEIYKTSK